MAFASLFEKAFVSPFYSAGVISFPAWDINTNTVSQFLAAVSALKAIQTDEATTFGSLGGGWSGGVLAPNGMIYGIPRNSTTVLKIDPTTDAATTFGSLSGETNIGLSQRIGESVSIGQPKRECFTQCFGKSECVA